MPPLALLLASGLALAHPSLRHARERTPIAPPVLRAEVAAAHVAIFGRAPSPARLRVAVAQVRLEGSARVCRNFGSITAAKGQPWCPAGRLRLAWWPTHRAGARAYWSFLRRRCPAALGAFDTGSAETSARALKACGFYEEPEATYAAGLAAILRERRP
jgi:hypothetical protein